MVKMFPGAASVKIERGQLLVTAVLLPSTPMERGKQVCRPLLLPVKRITRYSPVAILEREKEMGQEGRDKTRFHVIAGHSAT